MKAINQKSISGLTLHLSLLCCSLLIIPCSLHAQQVICVDVSNNTGIEDGTPAHPFNTILEGLQLARNGDTVSVFPGNYPEDTLLIEKCVSVTGENPSSTIVQGTFILSSKLDTLPVLIRNLWCRNVMHNDSGSTRTPLTVAECGLQTLVDQTPSVSETGRTRIRNCMITDSIHISNAVCAANREVINCKSGGGLWVSSSSSQGAIRLDSNQVGGSLWVSSTASRGEIRLEGNHVAGSLTVKTTARSDTIFILNNTVSDSLVVLSVASDPNIILNNNVGNSVRIKAVAHDGFQFSDNRVVNGPLSAQFTALSESVIENNTWLNGGINFKATSGHIIIKGNDVHTDGTESGIRLQTVAGGELYGNTITLPYLPPTGRPFETDLDAVCGIFVRATAFGGMAGNRIQGGTYGVYLSAIAANDFDRNEISHSHVGLYLGTVSGNVDSNRVEHCTGDGMILDYQSEYPDTNSIRLNYNIVRDNGGHGIRTRGNCLMGNLKEPGTGFNIIRNNGGYDLYVETLSSFADTLWAQNNQWTHNSGDEAGQYDIYDAADDTSRAVVIYIPFLPSSVEENTLYDFKPYPNPATDKLMLQFSAGSHQPAAIAVYDLNGKMLIRNSIPVKAGTFELDVSALHDGLYIIQIQSENRIITKKLIIQK